MYTCPACGARVTYGMGDGWRSCWWFIAVLTVASGIGANATLHRGYSWIPAGIGLLSFVVLWMDVVVRRRAANAHREAVAECVVGVGEGDAPTPLIRDAAPTYIAVLACLVTISVLSSAVGGLLVAGLNNAYSYDVVLQEAALATRQETYAATLNLTGDGSDICGGGEDYYTCLAMHIAMYNTVCIGTALTWSGRSDCEALREFIADVEARAIACGAGCTTRADANGRWGWEYLRPSPSRTFISNNNARREITYEEHCYFSLGPVQIGACVDESD